MTVRRPPQGSRPESPKAVPARPSTAKPRRRAPAGRRPDGDREAEPGRRVARRDADPAGRARRAEERLALREAVFSTQLETSLDGILIVAPDREAIAFNRRFLDLWDIPDDVAASRSNERFLACAASALADPGPFLERVAHFYAHPEERSREEIELRDGRTLDRYSAPLAGPDGRLLGRVWYFRDITAQKRAEAALLEERRLFAGGPTVVFRWKAQAGWPIAYVSPNVLTQLGHAATGLLGTPYAALVHPEDLRRIKREVSEHWRAGTDAFDLEYRIRDAEGRFRHVSAYTVLRRTPRGATSDALGYVLDVTRRRQAEEELRAANERLGSIIEYLPDATFVIDADKRVIAWNRATEEMTGVRQEDILGRGDYEYGAAWYGERRPIVVDLIGGEAAEFAARYRYLRREGHRVFAEVHAPLVYGGRGADLWVTASPLLDRGGRRVGAIETVRDVTARTAAETALRVAEERYRGLFDNAQEGIFQSRPDGSFLAVNPALAHLLGYESPADLVASTTATALYADPVTRRRWVDRVCQEGGAQGVEVELIRKDGSRVFVAGSAVAVRDEQGELQCLEGYVVDVTEKRRARAALAESEARYRSLYDENPTMYFTVGEDGTILSVNEFGASQLGYAPEDLVGRSVLDIFVPEERPVVREHLASLLGDPSRVGCWESRKVRRDGTVIWVRETARVVRRKDDRPVALVVCENVSEQKRSEERSARLQAAVAAAATEWTNTFDAVESALVVTDASGTVRRVNAAVRDLTGRSFAEMIGQPVSSLGAGEPWRTASRLAASALASAVVRADEVRDGSGRVWNLEAARFDAAADRVIVALHDVTALMELQRSARVRETMAAMGALVAGVAHEVRNPLFAISSLLDALDATRGQGAPLSEYLARLRRETDRLNTLMRCLLEYGRPLSESRSPAPLAGVVAEAALLCEATARERGVVVRSSVPADLPPVLMDRARLVEALRNVLENSVQHSPAGKDVDVAARALDGERAGWVELRVSDEGPGFPQQDRERILEPFFSRRPGGTGLGLAIVNRVVQAHGGAVRIEDGPSGGGVVTIQLPV